MKKISSLVIICLLFFDLKLQAQHIDTVSENIESKISSFLQRSGNEKAYLQFDRPYYAAGDTIYFKAYVTLGERHKLSVLSGVLHVDFINTINHIDRSLKLELKDGTACGDFALPDSLPAGNYRVRAYTNWMHNDGSNFFYEKSLSVYSLNNKAILNKSKKQQPIKQPDPEIQFMPEGGISVVGIISKIAFKAIDANGLGIDVGGKVIDNDGETVCMFSSSHFGMGCFNIKPKPGKTYKADVIFANGFHQVLTLPVALQDGITISVNNDTISKAVVRIKASNDFYRKNKGAIFQSVIYSGGKITKFNFNLDSGTTQFEILKRRLQTGVSTVTVFSPDGVPLCERLFFVQNYDKLNVEITGVKDIYNKREKVNVQLMIRNRADSAVSGHFSAAVISERVASYHPNDDNILSHFLLTADLKGYIEQPGYYFIDITYQKLHDLDLVMLTHGYRRFEWQQILNYAKRDLLYKPEKGLEISGAIKHYLTSQ